MRTWESGIREYLNNPSSIALPQPFCIVVILNQQFSLYIDRRPVAAPTQGLPSVCSGVAHTNVGFYSGAVLLFSTEKPKINLSFYHPPSPRRVEEEHYSAAVKNMLPALTMSRHRCSTTRRAVLGSER